VRLGDREVGGAGDRDDDEHDRRGPDLVDRRAGRGERLARPQMGGSAGAELIAAANQAFVGAMSTTAGIAAAVAIAGALIAALFLPARSARPRERQATTMSAPGRATRIAFASRSSSGVHGADR
jgi:hypothetical protein